MLKKNFYYFVSRLNGVLKSDEKDSVAASAQTSVELDSCDTKSIPDEADSTRNIETEISLGRLDLNEQIPDIVIEENLGSPTAIDDPDRIDVQSESESTTSSKCPSETASVRSENSSLRSSVSGSSVYPVSLGNEDSFDSSISSSSRNGSPAKTEEELQAEQQLQSELQQLQSDQTAAKDQQLLQLLADMNKMKRRCKHILDVTDRYCALRPGKFRIQDSVMKSCYRSTQIGNLRERVLDVFSPKFVLRGTMM